MKIIKNLILIIFLILWNNASFSQENTINIGLLKYGSVNWELDIIEHNELDKKNNFVIKKKFFSTKNAAAIALQGKAVDVIVTDWIWVSRQRGEKRNYVFYPHSMSVGGIMVKPDSDIANLSDLENKKLGVAGSSIDKSWLLLRAYSNKKLNKDPKSFLKPSFAAPPLLNELIKRDEIDAVLNYWHYNARLEAEGYKKIITVDNILNNIGIKTKIPAIGWVFSEEYGNKKKKVLNDFFKASNEAKKIMLSSDTEWERIFPLTKAKDRSMLIYLRDSYRSGIPLSFGNNEIEETKKVYKILSEYGGRDLVGNKTKISSKMFWSVE